MLTRIAVLAVTVMSCAHAQIPSIPAMGVLPDMMDGLLPRGQARPASVWKAGEKARYEALLAKGSFDVLVVPFQVQYHALGRSTRSLMTAQLALAVGASGKHRVPDPYLVARALGDGERRVHPDDVFRLADKLRVKTILWGYVGHNHQGRLFLSLQRQDRMESGVFDTHLDLPVTLRQFPTLLGAETPPEEAFRDMLPQVMKAVGIEFAPAAKRVSKTAVPALPGSPYALVGATPEPARDAYFLQLLAALAPASADRVKERYAEKSWLAAQAMSPESPSYDYLNARAWLLLGRRAAGLKALGTPRTPEEKHLLATLNGNMPEMERLASQIKAPAAALLARLDTNAVAVSYRVTDEERSRAAARALKLEGEAWAFLVERAFTDWSLWAHHDNLRIKQLLDREMPVAGLSLTDILGGAAAVGDLARMQAAAELSVVDHVRRLLKVNAARWCCVAFAPRPVGLDYVDLLESLGTDNLIRHARFLIETQGSPEAGRSYITRIEGIYKDHPQVTLARASAEAALAKAADGAARDGLRRSAYAHAFNAWYWEQGQTPTAAAAFDVKAALGGEFGYMDNLFANDLPFRAYYSFWQGGGRAELGLRNAHAALENSTFNAAPVQHLQHLLTRIQRKPEEFAKVLQSLEGRFSGNPLMVEIRAEASVAKGDTRAAAALYRESIRANPSHWQSYAKLGKILFEEGQTAEAARLFMSYPGFGKERTQHPVGLSNSAYEAGSLFFWSGALEHAKPLYRIAADLNTGSDASLSSAARLALLEGDVPDAAGYLLNRAQRYSSIYAYRDYIGVLHAVGHGREAWEGFGVLTRQLRGPQLWESALVGHRMEGLSEQQIAEWLAKDRSRDPGWSSNYAAGHLLRAGVIDRTPSAELASLVGEADLAVWKLDFGGGKVVRHVPGSTGLIVGPEAPVQGTILPIGVFERAKKERVQSDLAYFAQGYRAIRQGDFALAKRKLLEATTLYDVRNVDAGYLLPYLAFAAARQGDVAPVEKLLAGFSVEHMRFDYYLARAAISGLAGKPDQALADLNLALHRRPFTEGRPLFTEYQYAEICEWLFDATRERRYAALALSWAKANQAAQPWYAWPYAVEAKLATDPADRKRAIAMARYLDKGSERLSGIAGTDIEAAVRDFGGMNPFIAPKEKQGT